MSDAGEAIELSPALREGGQHVTQKKRQEKAATGASAATLRAVSARLLTFYFRAPVKAFFRTRVDYMGYVRAVSPRVQAGEAWSWRMTSPALLASAIRHYGWTFLPNQVLPPLLANTTVGAVLYTSYLQTLGLLHEPSSRASKRVYPPPSLSTAYSAGFVAGSIQSVIAAPVDALQVRFQASELMEGKYRNMWQYAYSKAREIGFRGIFAGWSLSFVKDAFGYGAFFATFEYVKSQAFYSFVSNYYGHYGRLTAAQQSQVDSQSIISGTAIIKPHYMIEPTFIALAGMAASITSQAIQYPISKVQDIHYDRLAYIDSHSHDKVGNARQIAVNLYMDAYRKTWKQCLALARREGGLRRWLYSDFLMSTLKQIPSTSVGLIVFEALRRKYSGEEDAIKIEKDGYDIQLS